MVNDDNMHIRVIKPLGKDLTGKLGCHSWQTKANSCWSENWKIFSNNQPSRKSTSRYYY